MLFDYGDIHVMGMKRNPSETIEVASLYNFFHLNNFENSSYLMSLFSTQTSNSTQRMIFRTFGFLQFLKTFGTYAT
jgi:hypothetical protein